MAQLRAFEILQVTLGYVQRVDGGDHCLLRVLDGKDTKTGKGDPRNANLPAVFERDLHQFAHDKDFKNSQPFVDLTQGEFGLWLDGLPRQLLTGEGTTIEMCPATICIVNRPLAGIERSRPAFHPLTGLKSRGDRASI